MISSAASGNCRNSRRGGASGPCRHLFRGRRPDALGARTPVMKGLALAGAYTFQAETIMLAPRSQRGSSSGFFPSIAASRVSSSRSRRISSGRRGKTALALSQARLSMAG